MTESRWLDADAVAKLLRVRVSQLSGMVGRGRIPRPSYHLGYRTPRWDRAVLEASLRDASLVKQVAATQEPEQVAGNPPPDAPERKDRG